MSGPATLNDVAIAAGVTHVTVSRAFSGKGPVALATREKVFRAAERIGYRPNTAARSIRTGRTGFIGMIRSPSQMYSVHSTCFDSELDETLHNRGLCLVRDIVADPAELEGVSTTPPRIVRENTVDGLLVNYAFGTPPMVRDLLDRCRIPAIWFNRKRTENCVYPNDFGAAFEGTQSLIAQGHRRIAYVKVDSCIAWTKDREPHYSFVDREAGYRQAMNDAGLMPQSLDISRIPSKPADRPGHLMRSFVEILGRADLPTALLCEKGGRVMLFAAATLGLRVPDDLSVMTFDSQASADHEVAVDRLLIRHRAMGRLAVEEICELIKHSSAPRKPVTIPFEFHRVGTVGPPRRS